jgi:hypothetical protein
MERQVLRPAAEVHHPRCQRYCPIRKTQQNYCPRNAAGIIIKLRESSSLQNGVSLQPREAAKIITHSSGDRWNARRIEEN